MLKPGSVTQRKICSTQVFIKRSDLITLVTIAKAFFGRRQSTFQTAASIIEYGSTLYVGLQLKQNGRPYKAMVRTVSKLWKEAFLKLQKVSSLHYHEFL